MTEVCSTNSIQASQQIDLVRSILHLIRWFLQSPLVTHDLSFDSFEWCIYNQETMVVYKGTYHGFGLCVLGKREKAMEWRATTRYKREAKGEKNHPTSNTKTSSQFHLEITNKKLKAHSLSVNVYSISCSFKMHLAIEEDF